MRSRLRMLALPIGAGFLSACIALAPTRSTDPGPAADVAVRQVSFVQHVAEPAALPTAIPETAIPRTAVILSAEIPAYAEIAAEILRRDAAHATVHTLSAEPDRAARLIAELATAKPDRIVAVGLLAAIAAREVPNVPTVFCQVYNYHDHDLVSATSKGVHLLPPFELQLREWRQLGQSPGRIGAVTGPGHDALLAEMRRAAESFGVELTVRTVRSDREALHAFSELAPDIDGFWLLPDNRILSPDVVRRILSYSAEHGKQVATFGESLLNMGALLSLTGDPRDVVDRVLARFEAVDEDGRLLGPDLLPLTAVRTRINDDVAERMGLIALVSTAAAR